MKEPTSFPHDLVLETLAGEEEALGGLLVSLALLGPGCGAAGPAEQIETDDRGDEDDQSRE